MALVPFVLATSHTQTVGVVDEVSMLTLFDPVTLPSCLRVRRLHGLDAALVFQWLLSSVGTGVGEALGLPPGVAVGTTGVPEGLADGCALDFGVWLGETALGDVAAVGDTLPVAVGVGVVLSLEPQPASTSAITHSSAVALRDTAILTVATLLLDHVSAPSGGREPGHRV